MFRPQAGHIKFVIILVGIGFVGYLLWPSQTGLWQKGLTQMGNQAKTTYTSQIPPPGAYNYPSDTPYPTQSPPDLTKYMHLSDQEPPIKDGNKTEKFYSPNKDYYLLKVSYDGGSLLAIYKSDGTFIGTFNPRRLSKIFAGVAKKFHDYWVSPTKIAFQFDSGEAYGSFYLDVRSQEFSEVSWDAFDFDSSGGFIYQNFSKDRVWQLSYINALGQELDLGQEIVGGHQSIHLKGFSLSGKYIVFEKSGYSIPGTNKILYEVYIFPVKQNGLAEAKKVGEIRYVISGIEIVVEPLFATWLDDEKKFKVNDYLCTDCQDQEFTNPFFGIDSQ